MTRSTLHARTGLVGREEKSENGSQSGTTGSGRRTQHAAAADGARPDPEERDKPDIYTKCLA